MKDAHVREKEIATTNIKYLVVEGDAIDIIRFPLVRMYEGHDLYEAVIHCFFEFEDGSGDADILTKELSPGGELVYAYWQVKGNATSRSGKLQIQLKAVKDATVIWHTKPATIIVEASLTPDELGAFTPTILDQYLVLYQGLVDEAKSARDKSALWAEEEEDVEVDPGKYSAKHHALKAAQTYSNFDARYLGEKASDPSVDNEGNALIVGAIYFNTVTSSLKFYSGSLWVDAMNGAGDITYNNASSGLSAENTQDAIDELDGNVEALELKRDAFENLFNSLTNPLAVKPVLNLDFANRKVLDPRITFTRASTGRCYDGKTFAKAEENLFGYSQQLDNAYWTKYQVVVTPDTVAAPDGTITADMILATATSGYHQHYNGSVTIVAGNTYIASYYAKAGGYTKVHISDIATGRFACSFDLGLGTAGTPTGVFTNKVASITSMGDGWYRISLKFTATISQVLTVGLIGYPDSGATINSYGAQYTGDGVSGFYGWGYQLEKRDSLTAYTPTTSQPITNYIPVLKEASADVARFDHDPVTGESLGLLIEEQRTNLQVYSETLSSGRTHEKNIIESNVMIAPDGSQTSDKMIATSIDGTHQFYTLHEYTINTYYTKSIYAKACSLNYLRLYFASNNGVFAGDSVIFDLSGGVIHLSDPDVVASITPVGDGWYRCCVSRQALASGSSTIAVMLSVGTTAPFIGDGYSGIYLWGEQEEVGSFPTSYIPTSGAQVTRSSDNASMTGVDFSAFYRQGMGSIYAEVIPSNIASYPRIIEMNDGTINNRIIATAGDLSQLTIQLNTAYQALLDSGTPVEDVVTKFAGAYAHNDFSACLNGGAVVTDTSGAVPLVDRMKIGSDFNNANHLNGHIKKIAYYNRRLSDADLQTLTA